MPTEHYYEEVADSEKESLFSDEEDNAPTRPEERCLSTAPQVMIQIRHVAAARTDSYNRPDPVSSSDDDIH